MALFPFIKDVTHKPYCGPTAVAILTGVPLSRAEHMIRRCRRGGYRNSMGKRIPIRGSYHWEVLKVLKRLGCKVQKFAFAEGTLQKFVDDTRHAGTFLVNVTGHYAACAGGLFADNSHPTATLVENSFHPRRQVKQAWKVIAPLMPKYGIDNSLLAARAPKPKQDVKIVRADKIVKAIKKWERREKLAKTKLKKLRSQLKRYKKLGIIGEAE